MRKYFKENVRLLIFLLALVFLSGPFFSFVLSSMSKYLNFDLGDWLSFYGTVSGIVISLLAIHFQLSIEKVKELKKYRPEIILNNDYVISNIGSFGENVYKIGVTRRLEPLERIRELSSASVPFQFDIHALIFSEEAFALETELHNQLSQYKVNKVNGRKEYFKVPFAIIKDILDTHKELTVELTENAEAFEYRQTKAIEEQQ